MFHNINNNLPLSHSNNIKPTHIEDLDPSSEEAMFEILNISKIKEGFYIGDKIAAISLDAITQFKITHIINCTGKQIINQWESIGINYLTLNWNEVPNQILFDPKDEIVDKIMSFIEKSLLEGEGLLVHSFKGQNRACLIALIYLMKKYKWSLVKSMQYLKSKKNDVDIMPNFYAQLEKYQQRLIQRGELSRDIPWEFENLIDDEEKLMRNTYMNGLPPDKLVDKNSKNLVMDLFNGKNIKNDLKNNNRHINWCDKDLIKPSPIEIFNISQDLILKKDINPVNCHLTMMPKKSCIKSKESKNLLNNNSSNNMIPNNFVYNNKSKSKNNKNISKRTTSIKKDKKVVTYNKPKPTQNIEIITQKKQINSSTNTNSVTPITLKDTSPTYEIKNNNYLKNEKKIYQANENNNVNSSEKDKLFFNIASLNSLNPVNIRNYGVIEETTEISKNNTNLNNCNNKHINNNLGNKTNVINNKPLNNFNPNLMSKKINKSNNINNSNNLHPLYYKNKNNGPIKIKNNNSNSKLKKPNTPDFNNCNVNVSNSIKGNSICNNLTSSLNNLSNTITGYGSKHNMTNNNKAMVRPSTAPHKEKEKNNNKVYEKKTKILQRPNSVGGKNLKNNNNNRMPAEKNNGYAINNVGSYFSYSNTNYLNSSNKGNNIWKNNSTSSNYIRGSSNGVKNLGYKNK